MNERRNFIKKLQPVRSVPNTGQRNLTGLAVTWDPQKERFLHDEETDSMIARTQRHPYETGTFVPISKGKE
jgi:hypothetical protein